MSLQSNTVSVAAIPTLTGTHSLNVDATSKPVGEAFNFSGRATLSLESYGYYDITTLEVYRDGVLLPVTVNIDPGSTPGKDMIYTFSDAPPAGSHDYYAVALVAQVVGLGLVSGIVRVGLGLDVKTVAVLGADVLGLLILAMLG